MKKARRGSRATASHPRISYSVFWGTYMIAIPLALSTQMSGSPAVGIMGKGLSGREGKCECFMVHNGLTRTWTERPTRRTVKVIGSVEAECTEEGKSRGACPACNSQNLHSLGASISC